ncbi:MAG: tryptophan 7-halogenase [Pseudomonadales bacterium]|nr:tryptophan 7-halogenase [Pseudomonadales bacterium]
MGTQDVKENRCTTFIIGASMAGSCLARQLKLKHPEMDIVLVDRKEEFDHWVGESTLEAFWDYAVRHLDLNRYLDTNHLYKHGLRFYFDSPEHDLGLSEMSEMGRTWFHGVPAHQLDRKRFDTDMCEMNKELGVDVHLGCVVRDIEIDADNGHLVSTTDGLFRCKYLIDAAGFASPVGKKLNLIESVNERHPVSAYWGRFRNTADIDLLGNMEWRKRVNHTSRFLATNHFMYKGYWLWLIPVDAEYVSIGLVTKDDLVDITISNQKEFVEFLLSHKVMKEILSDEPEIVDYKGMKKLARRAKTSYSTDRWFLTGMSSAFMDPMFSPGSAYLADANRMIGDLIETDMMGKKQEYIDKAAAYNVFSKLWFENFLLHISGNYHGSYELHRVLFEALLMHWFGVILPFSMSENWGYDPARSGLSENDLMMKANEMLEVSAIKKIHYIKDELAEYLDKRGIKFSRNAGEYLDIEIGSRRMRHTNSAGAMLSEMEIQSVENEMIEVSYKLSLLRIAEIEDVKVSMEKVDSVIMEVMKNNLSLMQGFSKLKEFSMINDEMMVTS